MANDEIIAVNDAPVVDFDSLILAVNAYSAGDAVRLKIRRGDGNDRAHDHSRQVSRSTAK